MKRLYPLLITFLFFSVQAFADGVIKGIVIDKRTGEPMVGSTVKIENEATHKKVSVSVGLDGSFTMKELAAGAYEVEAHYVSFAEAKAHVTVTDNAVTTVRLSLNEKVNALNEVSVKGHASRETDKATQTVVQRAPQLMNAVSARTIEVSPDITVANVTQRISGVSLERSNNGEGQYAIIRGMEKRYTYTLVNGFKIPSPDNKNRYIPLDIFPAEIVERLEVYKSLIPSMEGDAVAGGVNMVLKEAPEDFTVKLNLGAGVSQSVMNDGFRSFGDNDKTFRSPRINNGNDYIATRADFSNNAQHFKDGKLPIGPIAGLSIGGRTANKKFGALVSLNYQDIYKDTKGVFFATSVDATNNQPKVTDIQSRVYNTEQQRTAAIGRFDYRFDNRNKLTLDADYINLGQNQYRYVSDTSLVLGRTGIGQGRVTEAPRSIRSVQQVYNFTLRGDHKLADDFSVNWAGIYSKAINTEDRYQLNLVSSNTLQSNGSVLRAPLTVDASNGFAQTFAYNSDQDKSGYLNFIYTPTIAGTKVEFTAGGMYRHKTRSSTFDNYILTLPITQATQVYDGNIDHNTFELASNRQGTPGDPLNYDFTENVGAGYGQFKFNVGNLEAVGGVRYEHTNQSWLDAVSEAQNGKTGSIKYYDLLPSISLKYRLTDKQNLRASYYSAISRPNFYELVPHTSGDPDADYQEVGNPYLKRATADNYDLRYEFFPKGLDQFLAGVFYKKIVDPIEYALVSSSSNKDLVLEAGNFGTAHNYGLELDATKYFNHFGIRANYSFTESQITTSKQEAYKDAAGNNSIRSVDQTRPLQGQSKHLGNLSLLYKDIKSGLDAQISAVYTGERINSVSDYLNNDIWQKAFVSLDVSAEKRLYKGLFLYAKATNLLNTPYKLFIKMPYPPVAAAGAAGQPIEYQEAGKDTFVRKDNYQQYYILGVHYKF